MTEVSAKQVAFDAKNLDIANLNRLGAQVFFEREFPDIKNVFSDKQKCAVCIDEGTAHKDVNGEEKFYLAGSGILVSAESESERLDKVAKLFIERGITNVTSHGGCGPVGIAFKRDMPNAEKMINLGEKVENYAIDWSKKVVDKIKELGHPAEHTHILVGELERPIEFHVARVIYYDCIGGFNPNKEIGLPRGFIIERAYLPVEYAKEELNIAIDLVFSKHGFNDLFNSDQPFIVIALVKDVEDLKNYINEINLALLQNPHANEGHIKIDGAVISVNN